MIRLGVLASGGGTNLQALLDACAARRVDAEVALVVANVPGAGALARAEAAGVPSLLLPSKGVERAEYDARLAERLAGAGVDLVCLAGFMRLLSPGFIEAFGPTAQSRGCPRVMNVHPGLLPSFPGLKAQAQCLAYGARFAGCTVHFVDQGVDTGPIIAQAVVPVLPEDDEAALTARILAEEHRIYPQAVGWFAAGRLSVEGRRVRVAGAAVPARGLSSPHD
ncbi:phosphoribosylglycinamide formyltransferase [Anaeromyxobacter paludicola]|uniref:Phosphoribosylglycinamide formyltransferase n=1 Tax=Anaeromyxobacter paludicola TaxID=2918171 RepID=A0ABN6N4I9_9BACT|nr:phosphoribosylglycinamide formyltransferase [Anaeromyxobacter paludicola]BDG08102.1 phosphoribosylglycinamide formyltransferase [Anaeromyxobacter paludicola]